MLTVKTYLAPSEIHGIGLFAAEEIPAAAEIWKFNPFVDRVYTEKAFLKICQQSAEYCLKHFLNASYRKGGRYFYLTDNARFINHSDELPNIAFQDDYTEVALRDIRPHEELLENYRLSYDTDDFFFQEITDPDPYHYLQNVCSHLPAHAHRLNLS